MAQSFWGIVKGLVLRNDVDKTKTLTVEISSSATTGTDTKLTASQTASRILTLPDATDTLVGKATTDTLTNKTIDGDTNTVQDLALTSLKTNLSDANNFLVRDGSGIVISNTKAVPSGVVVGTTDSQTLTNKTIDGDDNTVQDLALTSLKTVLADANKFLQRDGSGIVVSGGTVPSGTTVGTTDTQTLSNKSLVDNSTFIIDNSDPTKKIAFDAAGTTGTSTTLASSQTTDRTITLPDATDTLVGKATTDTLTNKTIDGGIHTGTVNASASTNVSVATSNTDSTITIGTGSGNNTINIGGANSTITMTGTVLSEDVTNLTVTDKLITINKGGGATTGAATGLEIEENAVITGYAKTSADRNSWEFKAPNTAGVASLTPGSSADVVTLNAATQTLTNKTLTGNTAANLISGSGTLTLNTSGTITVPNATDTLVGKNTSDTLTNKTLTTPVLNSPTVNTGTFDVESLTEQSSSPSNPSAGTRKFFLKTDGKLYLRDSNGTETVVGSGSGSGINYILNPDAETNTTGWTTYADAAGTSPVDATGGSPNITFTRSTSSPLRGAASFLITKDAANRQGEGVSYAFTLDSADIAQELAISFDFSASANYTGSSGSEYLTCYVYDVTNGVNIATSNVNIPQGNGTQKITFNASSSTSYRLAFHVAGTGTSSWTFKLDNVVLGPQTTVISAAIDDWQSFTPTGSWSTNTTYTGFWRRVGDTMNVQVKVATAGAPTSATLTVNIPTGYSIDTNKLPSTSVAQELGNGSASDSDTTFYDIKVEYSSTSAVTLRYLDASANLLNVTQAAPFTFGSGDYVVINFTVPISNWSSNIKLANSRVEYASNSSGGTDADDTTSFVNDINGNQIPATTYTNSRLKRIRFANPILATDTIQIQVKPDNSVNNWIDIKGEYQDLGSNTSISAFINQAGNFYGIGAIRAVSGSTTDLDVVFGQYQTVGGTYGGAGTNWQGGNSSRWRVVKYSNAVPVGSGTLNTAEYSFNTTNGFGGTNTRIRRFTNIPIQTDLSGLLVNTTNSAATGLKVVVSRRCRIYMTYSDVFSGSGRFAITKNSAQLTTDVDSVTASTVVSGFAQTPAGEQPAQVSYSGIANPGDFFCPHTNANGAASATNFGTFYVFAEEIP